MNARIKEEIRTAEKQAIQAWHQCMGNKTLETEVYITEAGRFAERLCRAACLKTQKRIPRKSETLQNLIRILRTQNIISAQIQLHLDSLRIGANTARHSPTWLDTVYLNSAKMKMFAVVEWYQKKMNVTLRGLKKEEYGKNLSGTIEKTMFDLFNKGRIDQKTYNREIKNDRIYKYKSEIEEDLEHNPIIANILIDASGSMLYERDNVINNQNIALKAIRKSMICQKGALFLMQHTFNSSVHQLNQLTRLDESSNDNVISLTKPRYCPTGKTHLYDALHETITLMIHEKNRVESQGRIPEISLSIMTDGSDQTSINYTAKDISKLLQELKADECLKSAVVIGWTGSSLSESNLKKLTSEIGFTEYLPIKGNDEKAIRLAFKLWSQSFNE